MYCRWAKKQKRIKFFFYFLRAQLVFIHLNFFKLDVFFIKKIRQNISSKISTKKRKRFIYVFIVNQLSQVFSIMGEIQHFKSVFFEKFFSIFSYTNTFNFFQKSPLFIFQHTCYCIFACK